MASEGQALARMMEKTHHAVGSQRCLGRPEWNLQTLVMHRADTHQPVSRMSSGPLLPAALGGKGRRLTSLPLSLR